ncbi:hypothetical protein [Lactococcus cremoris]|uniref:Chromosome segregation protein SMC, smc n=1 Tax=Lactococcus lactis subsp. cremoris TaxID=1359 RepID=A0ABR5ED82_LACLC|nr:hypothetical protein [Lactococcus cremoris]KKW69971.1 chromosome segregation protein SMC, smc [Lactococcus cremoris]
MVDFSEKFNDKNLYSEDKLRNLAQSYVKANKVGIPKVTLKVSTVDLSGGLDESYNVEEVESLHLADTVKVFFEPLNITAEAKVVGSVYNVLLNQYDSYTLGAKKANFGQWVNDNVNEIKNVADAAQRQAIAAVISANGKNTNYYGDSGGGFPPKPKVGDLYFQKDGDKTTMYRWDGSSWVNLIDTSWQGDFEVDMQEKLDQAKEETDAALAEKDEAIKDLDKKVEAEITETNNSVSKAQSDATEAKTAAQDAVDKANASVAAVQANTQLINDVNAIANNAKSQAQTAATNAQTALTSANTAKDNANKAISDAGKLSEDVLALDTIANQAKSDADTALINANKGITDAKTALNKAIGVDTRVTTEITNVNNTLATKANSTTVDALSDTVSSQGTTISQNATDIKLKADSTVVNAIKGTVDNQRTLISQNASDIKIKANKSEVDTLSGRVSANKTAIDITSQGVSTLVTKTDGTNTSLSQFKQDYEGFKGTVYSKTQTDTKISTVQSTVDNFKTTVSNTYSSKSETDSKVTAVQANVDKIGNYTAYANSADGTDDFTTVYPNLNLLDGTKDFKTISAGNNTESQNAGEIYFTQHKKVADLFKAGDYITISCDVEFLNTELYSSSNDTFMRIQMYGGAWSPLLFNVRAKNMNGKFYTGVSNSSDYIENPTHKLTVSRTIQLTQDFINVNATVNRVHVLYHYIPVGANVRVTKLKIEEGSTATPYMPSEKELTSNDIPKYVGYSVRQSENPKDFSWQPYGGLNSYKIIEATTSIEQNSKDIALKANKSEVDTLSGKVSTAEGAITTMAGQIKLKANQTDVDTVKGRVTSAEGSISTMAGQIALKANQADVNTITGKVSSLESSFTVQSGQISALNTKTDGQTTQIGSLQSYYSGFESAISKIQTDVGGKADKTELSQLSQDLSGFKTTVANTYADKVSVASQINQSATAVTSNVQSWTNNKLTAYSTTQQTDSSIALAVADKVTQTQFTILNNQLTSVITQRQALQSNLLQNAGLKNNFDYWTDVTPGAWSLSIHPNFRWTVLSKSADLYARHMTIDFISSVTLNQTLTFVIRCKSNSSKNVYVQLQTGKGQSSGYSFMVPVTATMATYKVEIATSGGASATNIAFSSSDFALNDKLEIEYMKLVRGSTDDLAYYPASSDSASQSQITQLVNDINLRVIKGDVVNQINISPESILIAGNKVQITGETYIENGVINDAKIKTLSANKLTAGTIDAAKINVLNINAANITTGILNADRIGANSITATHINVANLAAISANLGTITAGTINAATVRIINLDAGAISTGTLNANLIAAYSITADKIKATSLDLFNNDFYTNVQPDGMRMQGKAQIIFGKWKDSSGVVRNSEGLYIGGYNAGVKYVALTRADGSTFMLRANSDMDIGTNTNVAKESLNIYDTAHFWYPQINHSDLTLNGYLAMGGGIQEGSIQYDKRAGTMNFRVPGGRSGSYFWFNQNVNAAGTFNTVSRLSLKNVKGEYKGDALKEICETNIVEYSYKNNPKVRQLSPIIDDVNQIKQFTLPDIINDGKTVNLYAMSSLSWLAIQELVKKLENVEEKIDAIA